MYFCPLRTGHRSGPTLPPPGPTRQSTNIRVFVRTYLNLLNFSDCACFAVSSMNATLVSREERVAAPHGSRAIRNGIVQVDCSGRHHRIVGNLKGNRRPELRGCNINPDGAIPAYRIVGNNRGPELRGCININPSVAIPAYYVVLGRDKAAVDPHASIRVPANNVSA